MVYDPREPGGDPERTSTTLLVRIQNPGDQQAWEEFVDRYGPMILGWCRRWFPREADDMVQEVLVRLVLAIGSFEYDPRRGRFRGWLETVTRHLMVDLRRRRRVRWIGEGDPEVRDRLASEETRTDLEQRLAAEYDLELLELARHRVRRRVAAGTWSAYVETAERGRQVAAVARELGMTVGSVSQAKYSVRTLLRREVRRLQGRDPR